MTSSDTDDITSQALLGLTLVLQTTIWACPCKARWLFYTKN